MGNGKKAKENVTRVEGGVGSREERESKKQNGGRREEEGGGEGASRGESDEGSGDQRSFVLPLNFVNHHFRHSQDLETLWRKKGTVMRGQEMLTLCRFFHNFVNHLVRHSQVLYVVPPDVAFWNFPELVSILTTLVLKGINFMAAGSVQECTLPPNTCTPLRKTIDIPIFFAPSVPRRQARMQVVSKPVLNPHSAHSVWRRQARFHASSKH